MTASRRTTFRIFGGLTATIALVAAPAVAQNSEAPVDVTAAPPPSADTIGPSQLQNFNLQGTVTKPADRPAPAASAPTASPPARATPSSPIAEQGRAVNGDGGTATEAERGRRAAGITSRQPSAAQASSAIPDVPTPSLPLEVSTGPAQQPDGTTGPMPSTSPLGGSERSWSWPWLVALIALIGGGAFIAWSRRVRGRRYADAGRMAFAGLVPDSEGEPAPAPPVRRLADRAPPHARSAPRPDPVPPRAQPAPQPDPVPPAATPRPRPPVDDGLIKSTALKPELNFQFVPDRAVVTDHDVMLQFDVVLTNSGAAPARDVLVEAKLVPAHAGQDQEIAAFFQQPQATGDRMAGIPPLGKVSLKSAVRLPLDQLHSFEVDGRKLFVPLVAFNILFRGSGGEGQASASFLVGRGNDEDEKLAPFRLDLGPRIFRGLSARPHSMGLNPQ
ncbi:MAG TPA: hypothetical protein VL336_01860 [Sphingomicrobium sp.]|jgi:hypothetical protein|nr:hypothetical protein [Sphingomicrobium sp.]